MNKETINFKQPMMEGAFRVTYSGKISQQDFLNLYHKKQATLNKCEESLPVNEIILSGFLIISIYIIFLLFNTPS